MAHQKVARKMTKWQVREYKSVNVIVARVLIVCIELATSETKEEGDSPSSTEPRPPENGATKPRALHITRSVYIRHIPAKISADDIIEVSALKWISHTKVTAGERYSTNQWFRDSFSCHNRVSIF